MRLWSVTRLLLLGVGAIFTVNGPLFSRLSTEGAFVTNAEGWAAVDLSPYSTILNALRSLLPAGIAFLLCSLVSYKANRGRTLRLLSWLGRTGDEQQQAAAIASLIGGKSVGAVLEMAASRFRTLPIDACSEEDWLSNEDTGLHEKTNHSRLGTCAAFVSHSWRDDGKAKYRELSNWDAAYRAAHGGEMPSIWLDKVPKPKPFPARAASL
jgi:hypothetical protein